MSTMSIRLTDDKETRMCFMKGEIFPKISDIPFTDLLVLYWSDYYRTNFSEFLG